MGIALLSLGLTACDGGYYDRYADSDYCDGVRTSGGTCIPQTRTAPTTPN